jgi:hypothetical protein
MEHEHSGMTQGTTRDFPLCVQTNLSLPPQLRLSSCVLANEEKTQQFSQDLYETLLQHSFCLIDCGDLVDASLYFDVLAVLTHFFTQTPLVEKWLLKFQVCLFFFPTRSRISVHL